MRALLFDLDGTLVDSETQTDRSIEFVAARHGVRGFVLPHVETRGRTWAHVAAVMRERAPLTVPAGQLVAELLAHWNDGTADVAPVAGAAAALHAAAAAGLRIAVVSSSPRAVIERLVGKLGAAAVVDLDACVGGDDVRNGKPDPEGFLKAAAALGVDPAEALVFEDSRAGLLAARAAGMRSMFVTCCATDLAGNATLATASCTDYRALPPAFWKELVAGSADLADRSFG